MARQYNPSQWYWRAEDGRVYSAPLSKVVTTEDEGYQDFLKRMGGVPPWPRDRNTGEQNDAAMRELLAPHDLHLTLSETLMAYARAKQASVAAGGTSVNVAPVGSPPLLVKLTTTADELTLIGHNHLVAQSNPAAVFSWVQPDHTILQLSAAQANAMFSSVHAHVQGSLATLGKILAAIQAGTITTKQQIDNPPTSIAPWPIN